MEYAYGNWILVIIISAVFLIFIKSIFQPRTRTEWTTYNSFGAFIVALFAEMYGFPLTIYILTTLFGNTLPIDFSHNSGHLLNDLLGFKGDPHLSPVHVLSYIFIGLGISLLSNAWNTLYKAQKLHKLATNGIYTYIRHPQYTGFISIILGFLLQWPTLITLIMAPILIVRYISLAREEEKEMIKEFGSAYIVYMHKTPRFLPSIEKLLKISKQKIVS